MVKMTKKLLVAFASLGLATLGHAELTINNASVNSSYATTNNESGLSQARSIMYGGDNYASAFNSYNQYSTNNPYDKLSISTGSRGVMVVDVESGIPLYEKNADVARPIASITKLMTAMVIIDAGLDMSEEVKIESIDFKYAGNKTSGYDYLKVGDRLNRAEMLLIMLMKSENPAGKALARTYPGGYDAFIRAMNQKAQSLGMYSANFGDPIGMDKNNVASPSDLVKMVTAAGNYDVIRRFSTTASYKFYVANYNRGNRTVSGRNTSYLVRNGTYPIGISKTGFINEAGKCVVMETRINNRPAVIVLLGASSSSTRWKDAETILQSLTNRYYTSVNQPAWADS